MYSLHPACCTLLPTTCCREVLSRYYQKKVIVIVTYINWLCLYKKTFSAKLLQFTLYCCNVKLLGQLF